MHNQTYKTIGGSQTSAVCRFAASWRHWVNLVQRFVSFQGTAKLQSWSLSYTR